MHTSKLGASELSRNKTFVYCGAVKRDNSEHKVSIAEFSLSEDSFGLTSPQFLICIFIYKSLEYG